MIPEMWRRISALTGVSLEDLQQRREHIRRQVRRIREQTAARNGFDQPVREEREFHAVVRGIDEASALRVRRELEGEYPWLSVTPSSRRVAADVDPLAHVLGRLGAVSSERIAADAEAESDLHRLRPGDRCGISGIERVAEDALRGTRGRRVLDFNRRSVLERSDPIRGEDVRLTIDLDLQRRVYGILMAHVDRSEHPAGGAAVVLDARTREILALVSYPTYHIDRFTKDYERLRLDKRAMPLRFRAVANAYPPGSTCKVIALYGALSDGLITPATTYECTGHLLADRNDIFRCWIYNQYRSVHGPQDAVQAIRNSCNIYLYHVGAALHADRLCEWFARWGLGAPQGTGLIEEASGIVPTESWLWHNQGRRYRRSDPWNYAIGQGEVNATPLQAANVAATVASGRWEPVRLLLGDAGETVPKDTPSPWTLDPDALRTIRTGMYKVVNERGATAYGARLDSDQYVMCGKTGSAQASRRVLSKRYTFERTDGQRVTVVAPSRQDALAMLGKQAGRIVDERIEELFPSRDEVASPSHAWFIGYTQSADTHPGDSPRGPVYAISVLVEYGGSGGRVAGPIVREIAEHLLESRVPD